MKTIKFILSPTLWLVLLSVQASAQVYEKLTDFPVVRSQDQGVSDNQERSDEPFDPFAEEKAKATNEVGPKDTLDEPDLGLGQEPDLDNEPDLEKENDSSTITDKDAEAELELERNQKRTESRHRISIGEYLRPINSISASAQTNLPPERGGINFPETLQPLMIMKAPRNTWAVSSVQWQKPIGSHRQLYFEDIPLERGGVQVGKWRQNYISGTTFLGDAILVPIRRLRQPRKQLYERKVDRFSDPSLSQR